MKKAIIIGAGPAGLTAAYELLKTTDIVPVVYEKSEMIGGISQTRDYKGNRIDLGGHRFFTKSPEVMALWTSLMPLQGKPSKDDILLERQRDFPGNGDPETEDDVFLLRNRISRIYYRGKFFDYPVSLSWKTLRNMGFVSSLKAGFGYLKAQIFKRKERSLEDFYVNRFGKPLYQMFFEAYTEKLWGRHPREISPEWGAQRVKGLSLFKVVFQAIMKPFRKKDVQVETSLIESFYYPKKGPGQLYEKMASEIIRLGGLIETETEVTGINIEAGNVKSLTIRNAGGDREVVADHYFSTMPVKDLIMRMNKVAGNIKEIASGLPYRDFITVGMLLKKIELANNTIVKTYGNIIPDCWIYVQEPNVKLGRIQVFNNWSPYMVKDFKDTIWIGLEYFVSEGDELWNASDQDFIRFATDELVRIGIIKKEHVIDGFRIKFPKAYPAYFDTYKDFSLVKEYLLQIENLQCIGRNGQHRYNNMDHSMLTAMKAVEVLKNQDRDKKAVWDVNTEQNYHETNKGDN